MLVGVNFLPQMYSHFGHSIKKKKSQKTKRKRKTVVGDFLRKYNPCSLEREANSLFKRERESLELPRRIVSS